MTTDVHDAPPPVTPGLDEAHARQFLTDVFGGTIDEHDRLPLKLVLCKKKGLAYWVDSIETAATVAIEIAKRGFDAYFHCALHDFEHRLACARIQATEEKKRPPRPRPFKGGVATYFRGTNDSSRAIPGLWLDIDFGRTGHEKRNLPPDLVAARAIVAAVAQAIGIAPSIVVFTGGGLHVYWLFREVWIFADDVDRGRARALLRAFTALAASIAVRLGTEREGKPWEFDVVCDLARVLRVPGTFNCKTTPFRTVEIIERNAVRSDPAEFLDAPALAPFLEDAAISPSRATGGASPRDIPLPAADVQMRARARLAELLLDPRFARLWHHEVDDEIAARQRARGHAVDASTSVYDYRIACHAVRAGWCDDEVRVLLHDHHQLHPPGKKPKTPAYFGRTIASARALVERNAIDRDTKCAKVDELPVASPAPLPTRPVVHDAAEAHHVIEEVASSWPSAKRSLSNCGFGGIGKTIAFGRRLMRGLAHRLPGFESGVGVLALPTRKLVQEKFLALDDLATQEDLPIKLIRLLGRGDDPEGGSWCEGREEHRHRAELRRSGCLDCPLFLGVCDEELGRYRRDRADALEAISKASKASGTPVLVVTTEASLHWIDDELPDDAPIVLDDAGALFGLAQAHSLRLDDVRTAIDQAQKFADTFAHEQGTSLEEIAAERAAWDARAPERDAADRSLRSQLKKADSPWAAAGAVSTWSSAVGVERGEAVGVASKSYEVTRPLKIWRQLEKLRSEAGILHPALVAQVVAIVFTAIFSFFHARSADATTAALRQAIGSLPSSVKHALLSGEVDAPKNERGIGQWPWEAIEATDGPDLRPSFATLAIEIAKEVLKGRPPVPDRQARSAREKNQPELLVYLPNHGLIRRARSGRVVWLGVGPMPSAILDSLGAEQEIILARPNGLELIVAEVATPGGPLAFGPFGRRRFKPCRADNITRSLFTELNEKHRLGELKWQGRNLDSVGAVLHLADYEALGNPDGVAYYGRDHASTDRLGHCELLIVRRFIPPYAAIATQALVLARAVGLKDPPAGGNYRYEARRWSEVSPKIRTCSFVDPLQRDMLRFFELHNMLNAIARCRPLSHTERGRVVILLCGRPFDWVEPIVRPLAAVAADLGIGVDEVKALRSAIETLNQAHHEKRLQRHAAEQQLLATGGVSVATLARKMHVGRRTIERDLADLSASGALRSLRDNHIIRVLIPRLSPSDRLAAPPSPVDVHAALKARVSDPPSLVTVRRILGVLRRRWRETSPGEPVLMVARRSDHARHLQGVVEVVSDLAVRAAPAGAVKQLVVIEFPAAHSSPSLRVAVGAEETSPRRGPRQGGIWPAGASASHHRLPDSGD